MRGILRFVIFIFVVYSILSGLIGLLKSEPAVVVECTDGFHVINTQDDRLHQREWEAIDYSAFFCTSYLSEEEISKATTTRRNRVTFEAFGYEDLWGRVYKNLILDSKSDIGFIVDSLRVLSNKKGLSRSDLAEMIVTFVQDIPYSYVLNIDCKDYETGDKPCVGRVALGLLAPYEFLHSLHGDCDTRAVLIYTLLEEFGFDPMIVVSDEYAHAMLALNIQAAGDHMKYRGKKYYFWETTSKGWPIGMLPPNASNINYWKIALVDEL